MEKNRKTTVPIQGIPAIIKFLLETASNEELEWMAALATKRNDFRILSSIFTRLTDYNVHEVFYEKNISEPMQLLVFRAAKRGEVAGLKAFAKACQVAKQEILKRKGKKDE